MKIFKLFFLSFSLIIISALGIKSQNILIGPEHFDANIIHQFPCSENCNLWISLAENKAHSILYYSDGGCTGGYAGYTGNNNKFYFGDLRTPILCTQGQKNVKLKFNLSNSYIPSHVNDAKKIYDKVRIAMWDVEWGKVHAAYIWPDSIKINGIAAGIELLNEIAIPFNKLRSCDTVEAFFTMPTYPDNKYAYFYLDAICSYNDAEMFSFAFDNVEISTPSGVGDCSVATSVSEIKNIKGLIIQQGNNNCFNLSSNGVNGSSDIYVFGSDGRLLLNNELQANASKEINLSTYAKGIYFIRIINDNENLNKKVLVY